jgi:hypothetical protein
MRNHSLLLAVTALCLLSIAVSVSGDEITAQSILISHRAGASAEGMIALVSDPANTIAVSVTELESLRAAGVPESVVSAIQARIPVAAPAAAPAAPEAVKPDHAPLEDLVKLVKSGISETLIREQIMAAGVPADVSFTLNDLLYLKQNGIQDSVIGFLHEARAASVAKAAIPPQPEEIVFNDLMFVRGFMRGDRGGRLVLKEETLSWYDSADSEHNFEFQVGGLGKVWLTCERQQPEAVCHELTFEIVKGAKYSFRDLNRTSGSNAAIMNLLNTLKEKFPNLPVVSPKS